MDQKHLVYKLYMDNYGKWVPITEVININKGQQIASHTKVNSQIRKAIYPLGLDVDTKRKRTTKRGRQQLHVWNRICKIEDSERLKRTRMLNAIQQVS